MTRTAPYADRHEAGRDLARRLTAYADRDDVVVLALPRGGVPGGAPVARARRAPLVVLVVRKLGLPDHPELARGALAGVGDAVETVRNERVLSMTSVSEEDFRAVRERELQELHRREATYRGQRPAVPVDDAVVIVVDDGLATGSTVLAAVAAVRRGGPARIVVAVPVGSAEACQRLQQDADEVVCGWTPEPFYAVGQGYEDFRPTEDDEVRGALETWSHGR